MLGGIMLCQAWALPAQSRGNQKQVWHSMSILWNSPWWEMRPSVLVNKGESGSPVPTRLEPQAALAPFPPNRSPVAKLLFVFFKISKIFETQVPHLGLSLTGVGQFGPCPAVPCSMGAGDQPLVLLAKAWVRLECKDTAD